MDNALKNRIRELGEVDDGVFWHLKALVRVALRAFCSDLEFIRDLGMSAADRLLTDEALSSFIQELSRNEAAERHAMFFRRLNDLPEFVEGWAKYIGSNYHLSHWNLKLVRHRQHRMSRLLGKTKDFSKSFQTDYVVGAWKALLSLAEQSPATYYQLRQVFGELCRISGLAELQRLDPAKKPIIRIVSASVPLFRLLKRDLDAIYELGPAAFEDFVGDRLDNMGMEVRKVGTTYTSDGGVDLIASPRHSPFPFLLAVQVKHHRNPRSKTGPEAIKDLQSVITALPFHAGMIVTNTGFTPDAQWWAPQSPGKLQLHDISSIRHWIEGRYEKNRLANIPSMIQLTPRLQVAIW